jgi:serine protease Do
MNRSSLTTFAVAALGAAVSTSTIILAAATSGHPIIARPAIAGSEDDQERIEAAVGHVEPSVVALDVSINGTRVVPDDPFAGMFGGGGGGRLMPFHEAASGSGFVYARNGLIVTNDHVVHGASKIDVVFANGDRIPAKIYAEDPAADLALVRVNDYAKLPPPVAFGASAGVRQGEWAIAIGEPFALKQTVTVGVVSGFNRNETIGGDESGGPREFKNLLQTSAPINPGNSGGPLVDLAGRVIGINQSVAQPAQDIGFAIPVDTVKQTVAMLAAHPGTAVTSSAGFLGVELQTLNDSMRSQLNYTGQGAAVVGVVGGSPADRAGLQPGDVIQGVNGTPVTGAGDAVALIRKIAPGRTASLRVWSNGWRKLVGVRIGAQPTESD